MDADLEYPQQPNTEVFSFPPADNANGPVFQSPFASNNPPDFMLNALHNPHSDISHHPDNISMPLTVHNIQSMQQTRPSSPEAMPISPNVSMISPNIPISKKSKFSMGPRANCEKCRLGVKGHWAHFG